MKSNYTELEYQNTKSEELLSCLCYNCNKEFETFKKNITRELKHKMGINKFCSKKCQGEYQTKQNTKKINCSCCNRTYVIPNSAYNQSKSGNHFCSHSCNAKFNNPFKNMRKRIDVTCKYCGKEFDIIPSKFKKTKSGNHFCSSSCAATYNNTHKKYGTRKSKLEKWLETKLIELYPDLEIHFNRKDVINSELDIYIPSLKLAFELNGLFHYKPIFGKDKLLQIQNNDNRKFQSCLKNNIKLYSINTSQQKYFKEKTSFKYLNIITNIINERLI